MKQGKIRGVAVAVITATLLLGAANTSSAKPFRPDSAPTVRKTLGPNALKKLCVKQGLRKPILPQNFLARRGERRNGHQEWWMSEGVWLLPSECNGTFRRFLWIKPEVQDPAHPKLWRAALRPRKHFVFASNRGALGDEDDQNSTKGDYNNRVDASQLGLLVDLDASSQIYQCAPGPRKNRARVKVIERLKNVKTGRFVAGRVWKFETRVIPAC